MGQRRRAVLAAAFVATPATVLLDEPLEAMDRSIRLRVDVTVRAEPAQPQMITAAVGGIP